MSSTSCHDLDSPPSADGELGERRGEDSQAGASVAVEAEVKEDGQGPARLQRQSRRMASLASRGDDLATRVYYALIGAKRLHLKRMESRKQGSKLEKVSPKKVVADVAKLEPKNRKKVDLPRGAVRKLHQDGSLDSSKLDDSFRRANIVSQLKGLVGRRCRTSLEKYNVLQQRDTLMCAARVKFVHVDSAAVIKGSCADMCPEKERYMREVRNEVNIFECGESGTIDAMLAVKDYSRSAASQEDPLAHELRPPDVLHRTMEYLIGKIADEMPGEEGGLGFRTDLLPTWYDFLWSRTRAIRKDITQQMLVNEVAVSLMERCTRFHIFASHRLCTLSTNEFDQKMNTENLTKCLLSLRHLYDDLAKRNVFCPNESEFRAYDLLLNLTDSNVLSHFRNYRREVRSSEFVRLALRLFLSVQSGNYRRFFGLLRTNATYLQCCICYRYFHYVRWNALSTMVGAFTTGRDTKFPLEKFAEILGFDGVEHASCTVKQYGFQVESSEVPECVVLNRVDLRPFGNVNPASVHLWIEAKRKDLRLSQVLSGGETIVVKVNPVTNSFTEDGIYSLDSILADFIAAETHRETVEVDVNSQNVRNRNDFSADRRTLAFRSPLENEFAEESVSEVISHAVEGEIRKVASESLISSQIDCFALDVGDLLIDETVRTVATEVHWSEESVYLKQKAAKAIERRKEIEESVTSLTSTFTERIMNGTVQWLIDSIASNTLKREERSQMVANVCDSLGDDVIEKVLSSVVVDISNSELKRLTYKLQRLGEIRENLKRLKLKLFADRWRGRIAAAKEYERMKFDELVKLSVAVPGCNLLRYSRLPSMINPSELLFEAKLEGLKLRRMERIAKKAFTHWRNWTRAQVERTLFFKEPVTERNASGRERVRLRVYGEDPMLRIALMQIEVTRDQRVRLFSANYNNGTPPHKFRLLASSMQREASRLLENAPMTEVSSAIAFSKQLRRSSDFEENTHDRCVPDTSPQTEEHPSTLNERIAAFRAELDVFAAEQQKANALYDKILNECE